MSRPRPRSPDRVVLVVGAVVALAVAARVAGLGDRPFHWDEARVGYWTLRSLATGEVTYRPVAGGPFVAHAARVAISLLGASDASARLAVALVGGCLPAGALVYRDRLGDAATVALAALLAVDPLVVYYGRFLRGEVPLLAASFVAVAAAIRAIDAGRAARAGGAGAADDAPAATRTARRYALLAAVAGAVALTTSGFAVVTAACVAVAVALVADHRRVRDLPGPTAAELRARVVAVGRRLTGPTAGRAGLLAGGVLLFAYAPRAGDAGGPGLWRPTTLPAAVDAAVAGSVASFYGVHLAERAGAGATHQLLPYVGDLVGTLWAASAPLVALAVVGVALDRYSADGPSTVVSLHAYWAGAALLAVPFAAEVSAPWLAVHVAVPLTVPAAVGAAALVRVGRRAWGSADAGVVAAVALCLVAAGGHAGAVAAADVYGPPSADSRLAGYAQPTDDPDALLANVTAAVARDDGPGGRVDVVYHGGTLSTPMDASRPPVPAAFAARLPLAWYLERADLSTTAAATPAAVADAAPPVVVTTPGARPDVAAALRGAGTYAAVEFETALWDRQVVVFVRR